MNILLGTNTDRPNGVYAVNEIDDIVAASAMEFNCENLLDYCRDRYATLNTVISKLRHGGRLLIKGNDITQISRMITTGHLTSNDGATMLYSGRQSTVSAEEVLGFLNAQNLKIIKVITEGVEYFIVAERQ